MAVSTILALVLILLLPSGARAQEATDPVAANRVRQERQIEERMAALAADPETLYFARSELPLAEQEELARGHLEEIGRLADVSGFDTPDHEQIVEHAEAVLRQAPDVPVVQMVHWNLHHELYIVEREAASFEALETYVYKYPEDLDRVMDAWDRLANRAAEAGDWGLSLYYIDRYLEVSGVDYPRLLVRARALIGLGDREAGRALLERIVAESEGTVEYNLAMNELEALDGGALDPAAGGPIEPQPIEPQPIEQGPIAPDAVTPEPVAPEPARPALPVPDPQLTRLYAETMDAIREAATALQTYHLDYREYPASLDLLVPDFLLAPAVDAWGRPLLLETDGDTFRLGSGGSDGEFAGFEQQGTYTDLVGGDIIFSEGAGFVLGPAGRI